jgi:hypothetical protein
VSRHSKKARHWQCLWNRGLPQEAHACLLWGASTLAVVAPTAACNDVLELGLATLRSGLDVISVETTYGWSRAAVLALVLVSKIDVVLGIAYVALDSRHLYHESEYGWQVDGDAGRADGFVIFLQYLNGTFIQHRDGLGPIHYLVRGHPWREYERVVFHDFTILNLWAH